MESISPSTSREPLYLLTEACKEYPCTQTRQYHKVSTLLFFLFCSQFVLFYRQNLLQDIVRQHRNIRKKKIKIKSKARKIKQPVKYKWENNQYSTINSGLSTLTSICTCMAAMLLSQCQNTAFFIKCGSVLHPTELKKSA